MAVTYTWTIANMERNTADDGVTFSHWRCEGVDGDHSATAYGTTSHTPDPSDAGFVAYADLTEATVLGWVHASLDKDATESAIADKINAMANPTTAAGTPWAA
jgi:hypothetical protein